MINAWSSTSDLVIEETIKLNISQANNHETSKVVCCLLIGTPYKYLIWLFSRLCDYYLFKNTTKIIDMLIQTAKSLLSCEEDDE